MTERYDVVFIDTEVGIESRQVKDYGAVSLNGVKLHSGFVRDFADAVQGFHFMCGHNIWNHDLKYIPSYAVENITEIIDTLLFSPLLFPKRPYHKLVKDDKLQADELNNPLNDAIKCQELFYDEVNAFAELSLEMQCILYDLLYSKKEFHGFFEYCIKAKKMHFAGLQLENSVEERIHNYFDGKICSNCRLQEMINNSPVELAYSLAFIDKMDSRSVIPRWVYLSFPKVEVLMKELRGTPCADGCSYCDSNLSIHAKLKQVFQYDNFRTYGGEPLQEKAVAAAMKDESLIVIFPTGGGKSLTFQLPALIKGESAAMLTVVISPLQSLMKDQVDNLAKRGIVDAVTINGLLSPLERAEAIQRVENGTASLLYISPEQLRSHTIHRILLSRQIARFVIDEAHCFSAWGQDFRVEYLYIGEFIRNYMLQKQGNPIPVSCFTATAKPKVISDIKDYFQKELGIDLKLYATSSSRSNLRYQVIHTDSDDSKYALLRELIEMKKCPTIVYVSRTKRTQELAERLCVDGYTARAFNGKMESDEKVTNQNAFINDEVQIIVATSAFGMGVDKSNVQLVVHYDISDSLENYVQEAGRAGRDQNLEAECYILYNDNDLDKHFILLNQTKLSISEIQQVWKAIKEISKDGRKFRRSPLEIARMAGWDESVSDVETRVKTAIQALERAGYIKRGLNYPKVFATSISVNSYMEASEIIDRNRNLDERMRIIAKRIIQMLISKRSVANAGNDEAESRIDYISDLLGVKREDTILAVNQLKEMGVLQNYNDLTAYIQTADKINRTLNTLKKYIELELFLLRSIKFESGYINLKELNDTAIKEGIKNSTVNRIRTILYFWTIRNYLEKSLDVTEGNFRFVLQAKPELFKNAIERRACIAQKIAQYLFDKREKPEREKDKELVGFSELELKDYLNQELDFSVDTAQIEDALLYMSKIGAMKLEDGFLVLYSSLEIERLIKENRVQYKADDYKYLDEYYKQKIQQIHIVGEFANIMSRDYNQGLQFVNDYFQMDYKQFIKKYFDAKREQEIKRNITPQKYDKLFGTLSESQLKIIRDDSSQYIVVAAGPGSGKTRVLVHKLASLLLLEDVKHEQLLMVTFSRAAANEFKQRLYDLIGNAAAFVEVKTFHSYCFDLLGKIGNVDESADVIKMARQMIMEGEVEAGKIAKSVLVIDEAQDMSEDEYLLICTLMEYNEQMRVIAVGDDDQNIYEFRGSDSKYMQYFIDEKKAVKYELVDNYRSCKSVVAFANAYARGFKRRMKESEIVSMSSDSGEVELHSCVSKNMEYPLINELIKRNEKGTRCVLTCTNKEALTVLGLLNSKGIPAKLIQSNDGFQLYDLIELRFLMNFFTKKLAGNPMISDTLWDEAKQQLFSRYQNSECLDIVKNILSSFERSYPHKYFSDFVMYIKESALEDFYTSENEVVYVSTIHKSKGREYDSIYMMLNGVDDSTDERKHGIYVGITRAKNYLGVFYNNGFLDQFEADMVKLLRDNTVYHQVNRMIMQFSHKDVVLDFFKGKESTMLQLQSGMKLQVASDGLYCTIDGRNEKVLIFSKKCKNEIYNIEKMGFRITEAKVRFVVGWKDQETGKQHVIILPDLIFSRE